MTDLNRRGFIALGAGGMLSPALASISDATQPLERQKRLDLNAPLEDNLIEQYLQPKPISLRVGARKPFTALHCSDTHVSMADAADILSYGSKDLRLYEARNNGVFGRGGFPFAVQSLAATLAYARRKKIPLLNTGDLFDFRSEANIACVARSFAGADVFSSLGNHEGHGLHTPGMNPRNAAEEDKLRARYEKAIGNPLVVASRVINGVNFVAFDNCEMARFIRDRMVQMIKAEFAKGMPTVLMCHMPPFSREIHEADLEMHRVRKASYFPKPNNLDAYYMMGEDFEKTKAPKAFKELFAFLAKQDNFKAMLCGHLHFEWQGLFNGKVPVVVAGRNFNGECYEISFS
ncbi:MAG: metallophosphoesterase [Kiritimatiellae bacterium]|nr:metallophosphoesterase [Kiritimatiellia bacterium]